MGDKKMDIARIEAIVYNKNQSRIVCPHCGHGRDATVDRGHVRGKVSCTCGKVFYVLFVRRACKRKVTDIKAFLHNGDDVYTVRITDISLQGFGICISSHTQLNVGMECELIFRSHDRDVKVTVEVVRVHNRAVGLSCLFVGEHSGARTAIGRIFDKI